MVLFIVQNGFVHIIYSQLLMRNLLLFFVSFPLFVFAQKPNPTRSFEIKLSPENEAWHLLGNMRISDATGYPAAIYQAGYSVNPADPESMARSYLMSNQSLLGLRPNDISNLKLHAIRASQTGHTVRLRQMCNGLPVNKNAEITVHITKNNVVDYLMNGFQYGVQMDVPANLPVSATMARQLVDKQLNLTSTVTDETSQLMVLHHDSKNYLVHHIVFLAEQPLGEWDAYVDARTGTILKLEDASLYHKSEHEEPNIPAATNMLWVVPPAVNGSGLIFEPDPLSSATVAYAGNYVDNSDATNASLEAEQFTVDLLDITLTGTTYSLVGPYAAIQDFEAPNKGLFTQSSPTFNFNRAQDGFEAVNTYYHIDNMMRYLNLTLGVTIMPYQYAGGVRFDPSGLSGADNSHYIGSTGRLAFGEGGVDDAEDADVVVHELGHGIHDWITSGGLSQVNGLSEGSGDYWAGSYSRSVGNWVSSDPAYNWMFNWDGHNPFWGGRILNYTAVYPGGLVGAIHTDGQIWATAMMNVWNDIGREKSDKAFWLGLDVTNSSTNQNDAANAVYQAAINLGYSYADRLAIRTRFVAAGYTLPALPPAPVELVRFQAKRASDDVLLTWTTTNEQQNDFFTIEKSSDGRNFELLGVKKGAGTTQVENNYSMTDFEPLDGTNYYRLKQTDFDGTSTYSQIVSVRFDATNTLFTYPNPASESITIVHHEAAGVIFIYDINGRLVRTQMVTETNPKTGTVVPLSGLATGMYSIQMVAEGQVLTGKFYRSSQ
jgi:zinc metalloprotease ZmpB